jgi:hypothetical protein
MPRINIVDIVVLRSHVQILVHVSFSDIFLGVPHFLHECVGKVKGKGHPITDHQGPREEVEV